MIIEWNTHLFSSDTTRFPIHSRASYTPDTSTYSADPLADYLQRMAEENIDRAIIVHPGRPLLARSAHAPACGHGRRSVTSQPAEPRRAVRRRPLSCAGCAVEEAGRAPRHFALLSGRSQRAHKAAGACQAAGPPAGHPYALGSLVSSLHPAVPTSSRARVCMRVLLCGDWSAMCAVGYCGPQPLIISTRFHAHRGKEEYLKSFAEPGVRNIWKTAVRCGAGGSSLLCRAGGLL